MVYLLLESIGVCYNNDTLHMNPIFLITFGSGSEQYARASPSDFNFTTSYGQQNEPSTGDGQFSFINEIHNDYGTWYTGSLDHTPDDVGGYMMLVNAAYQPGEFYRGTVNSLCIGLRYEFSFYLANIHIPNSEIQPNILIEARSLTLDNRLLVQVSTGDIPSNDRLIWLKYGLSFIAPSHSVVLLMISNASGGYGNDFVIDDIALRVCSNPGSGVCPPTS
ncbi:unnamed protein product [Rotaria sp. Silwood2]|nr:unnamed protein product [Rotaria sp. Silwood2]CAF2880333.1 unnamed protein product [Rotaria sp. Silwood2]CAF3122972.1 unnamed protein product [Rotaria sp. Silwood2]CAF3351780.1 unnamed protein product [Rotaria sp. Silwood2]CAF3929763.1 unnamed protein product [Rotaria sp. Silwood2]